MRLFSWWVGLLLSVAAGSAQAATLTFDRVDLPDVVSGEDLWQDTFTLSGALPAFSGITVFYPQVGYGALDVPSSPPELGVLVTQPDVVLGVEGLVTLTALQDLAADFSSMFAVTYLKQGVLSGSYAFEVFDENFSVVSSGRALPSGGVGVPAPWLVALLPLGLAGLWYRRRVPSV